MDEVRQVLADRVAALDEGFDTMSRFRLNQRNRSQIAYLLARMTSWIEREHGPGFVEYVSRARKNRFEVEHIWANHAERHTDEFPDPRDFADTRDMFGDLLLLPKDFNASYNDATYAEKVRHYPTQNLLARSLTPIAYSHNPTFQRLITEHQLPFKPYPDVFTSQSIQERQSLYQAICEQLWSPERLGLAGGTPPPPPASEGRKRHFGLTLRDVLANSGLTPGPLMSGNSARPQQATLNADGTITVGTRTFDSPSGASDFVTGGSTNGWDFWAVAGTEGGLTRLTVFRDEADARLGNRQNTEADTSGNQFNPDDLHTLLHYLRPGEWATYGDVAALVGTSAQALGSHMLHCPECDGAHRVLTVEGRPSEGFRWSDPSDTRTCREALESEGITFTTDGRANPEHLVTGAQLAERIPSQGPN